MFRFLSENLAYNLLLTELTPVVYRSRTVVKPDPNASQLKTFRE